MEPLAWIAVAAFACQDAPPVAETVAETVEETFETLDAEFDAAVVEYLRALSRGDQNVQYPGAGFYARYREIAGTGDERALLWLTRNLTRKDDLPWVFESVRDAGEAEWVPEAVANLVPYASRLGEEEMHGYLEDLASEDQPSHLRIAGWLGLADLAQSRGEQEPSLRLRLRALVLQLEERELGHEEVLAPERIQHLTTQALAQLRKDQQQWYQVGIRDIDGSSWVVPHAPPRPDALWSSRIAALADSGGVEASLWLVTDGANVTTDRERLRERFRSLAGAPLTSSQLASLSYRLGSFMWQLEVDEVEAVALGWAERAEPEDRALVLSKLGEALCEQDAAAVPQARERGLALLRQVIEEHAGSSHAAEAQGKLYRFTELVIGKPAPDFEAVDADGNPFRLSDYKGKVTVLDFWGFW